MLARSAGVVCAAHRWSLAGPDVRQLIGCYRYSLGRYLSYLRTQRRGRHFLFRRADQLCRTLEYQLTLLLLVHNNAMSMLLTTVSPFGMS